MPKVDFKKYRSWQPQTSMLRGMFADNNANQNSNNINYQPDLESIASFTNCYLDNQNNNNIPQAYSKPATNSNFETNNQLPVEQQQIIEQQSNQIITQETKIKQLGSQLSELEAKYSIINSKNQIQNNKPEINYNYSSAIKSQSDSDPDPKGQLSIGGFIQQAFTSHNKASNNQLPKISSEAKFTSLEDTISVQINEIQEKQHLIDHQAELLIKQENKIEKLQIQLTELEEKYIQTNHNHNITKQELNALTENHQTLQYKTTKQHNDLDKLQEQIDNNLQKNANMNIQVQHLSDTAAQYEKDNEVLTEQNQQYKTKITDLERRHAEQQRLILMEKQKNHNLEQELINLKTRVEKINTIAKNEKRLRRVIEMKLQSQIQT